MQKSNRAIGAQKRVVDLKVEEMLVWYAANSGGKVPDLAVDDQSYKGKGLILRWLEPVLPNIDNPILIEESLGDSWSLRMEVMRQKIQVGA